MSAAAPACAGKYDENWALTGPFSPAIDSLSRESYNINWQIGTLGWEADSF